MLTIKVPASTSNLGCGFDSVGIAFNLYNTWTFEQSKDFELIGFENGLIKQNMVLSSYQYVFQLLKKDMIPVRITLIESQIPISRGLGSSASCIIAGVLAANHFLDSILTKEECITIATQIEGHPDNISASLLGGFVSSFIKDDVVRSVSYPIDKDLNFYVLIPNFNLSTKVARAALPKNYLIEDVVFSLSRAIQLPYGLAHGDVKLLKDLLDDKIHEPYRFPLINQALEIKNDFNELEVAVSISGAGPSILLISKCSIEELNFNYLKYKDWNLVALDVSYQGATLMVQSEVGADEA